MYLPNIIRSHAELGDNEILKIQTKSGETYEYDNKCDFCVVGGDLKIIKNYKGLKEKIQNVVFIDPNSIEVLVIIKSRW